MEVYPISIKHAICYLVKVSDFYIAIDAGWAGHINEYLKMMHGYGINQDKIKYLFVTHFHPDHAGLVENIKRFGTTFAIIAQQIPYIGPMEKMLAKERSYAQIELSTSRIIDICEAGRFLEINHIPAQIIQTTGHSEDSISIVFSDGDAFVGDLYRQNLVMEDDFKSRESWELLKKSGAKRIYFAHGEENILI